jgi:hypothetical protein
MKSIIFWDITPCSPLIANGRFGGIHHLLQGRKIIGARNQRESMWQAGFFLDLFFDPEDGDDVPPKRRLTSTDYTELYPRR